MAMIITTDSHTDHSISGAIFEYLTHRFADRAGFFIETITIPLSLGTVGNALVGPACGDDPVAEAQCYRATRGGRAGESRMVRGHLRQTRTLTVIAGPDGKGNSCVLYTAHGGPAAPREPWDPGVQNDPAALAASVEFWAVHALSDGTTEPPREFCGRAGGEKLVPDTSEMNPSSALNVLACMAVLPSAPTGGMLLAEMPDVTAAVSSGWRRWSRD